MLLAQALFGGCRCSSFGGGTSDGAADRETDIDAGSENDIDIVVISPDLERWPALDRLELLSRLTAGLHAPLEVLGYTPEEVLSRGRASIIWAEVLQHGRQMLAA